MPEAAEAAAANGLPLTAGFWFGRDPIRSVTVAAVPLRA